MRVQLKNLICTTDFSELSNRAVPYAVALTRELDSRLYLYHVVGLPATAIYGEILVDLVEQQNKAMKIAQEQLIDVIGKQQIDWQPLVSLGHISDEITHMAAEKNADLVIMATHGRSGLKRLVLGSVTERLIRTLPCPVLIIPGADPDAGVDVDQGLKFKRILIGCDFSAVSIRAFQYGLSLAQEFQSEIHMVHVIAPPVYRNFDRYDNGPTEDISPDLRNYLNEKMEKMVPADARNWCVPKTVLLEGKPDEALIEYANANRIDMIVLGVRGQGLVEKVLVGSTTSRVIRRAVCPVLSVSAGVQDA